jgi:hypothetical protein
VSAAWDLLLLEHTIVHARVIGDSAGSAADPLAGDLPDESLRRRPHGLNSVAWCLYHTARSEDVGVNRFVAGQAELYDLEDWAPRLALAHRHTGAGMTDAEVDELSAHVDLDALKAYRLAVGRRTRAMLPQLDTFPLGDVVDPALVEARVVDGTAHPALPPDAVRRAWAGRSRGWFLFLAAGHNLMHLGEAITIRSCLA